MLHLSVIHKSPKCLRYILSNGIETNLRDYEHRTADSYIINNNGEWADLKIQIEKVMNRQKVCTL
jgi:dephospho-CoA kinase